MNSWWRSSMRCSASASRRTSSVAACRRVACHTMATNMAAMSGTSANSSMPWWLLPTDQTSAAPVSSKCLRRLEPIPDISHRLDELGTQFRPKPADVHVHHVASRIERVTPHVCQQLFPGTHLARLPHQVLEEEEFALGKVDRPRARVGHPTKEVHVYPSSRQQARRGRRL